MRTLVHTITAIVVFLAPALLEPAVAATVSGTVRDAETNRLLVGANVYLDGTLFGAVTAADGSFKIAQVPPGRYTVTASFVGYTVAKRRIELDGRTAELAMSLAPEVLPGQTIVVTATRARERETPAAFSNLTRRDLRERYTTQDVPMLLQTMPSAYAYSDAGNGVGYSYLTIRGFNQKRINVLINGIPHNGPTSHEVYWIDLPDLLANAEDVQVQRGVGSSLYGSAALGGSVNIVTSTYGTDRRVSVEAGAGSFDTRKYSFAFNSGLVDNSYVMYGRFSRIRSDGYRELSWTSLWSYFLGVARYDATMTMHFQVYGGPEQTHLAYDGVDSTYIRGLATGNRRRDRRYNPLQYEDELDNFNQPHYELQHDWRLADGVELSNTLYTIKGRGSYDQFRTERSLEEYRLPTFTVSDPMLYPAPWYKTDANDQPMPDENGMYTVERSDLIKSRWVDDDEYGWLPRVRWEHPHGALTVGGELRSHRGQHWGLVSWLSAAPPGIEPDHPFYYYTERKLTTSAFAHEMLHLTPRITLMADVQAVSHRYTLEGDTITHYAYETEFRWLAPKTGVNVNLTDRVNVFGSVAFAKREPVMSDLVDPQDYWSEPAFTRRDTVRVGGRIQEIRLSEPTVEPESMIDVEVGAGYRSPWVMASINLYNMDFHNEIVPWAGQISEASGLPITGNADHSVHQGIELEAALRLRAFIELGGNLNLNNDHFVRYTENAMDWDVGVPVSVRRDGNRIAGFPTMLANLRGVVSARGFFAGANWRYVGRQYLDNSETRAYSIGPYHVTDLMVGCRLGQYRGLKGLEVRLQINNIFDRLYEPAGYMDDVYAVAAQERVYGTPYYIPAATRNAFVSARWDL